MNNHDTDKERDAMKLKRKFAALIIFVFLLLLVFPGINGCSDDKKVGGAGLHVGQLFDPQVHNNRGWLVVLGVLDGMPAKRVGMEKGDIITHINGEAVQGQLFEVLVSEKIMGPIGTSLSFTVKRSGIEEKLYFNMNRVEVLNQD